MYKQLTEPFHVHKGYKMGDLWPGVNTASYTRLSNVNDSLYKDDAALWLLTHPHQDDACTKQYLSVENTGLKLV